MQLSVLVETVDGRVHAFDALSGEKLWESETEGALVRTSITPQRSSDLSPKAAIVPGVDGQLYSIKLGSQAIQKLGVKASDVVQVSPNIAGDGSIVLGSKRDAVFVIHPLTGEVLSKITSEDLESPKKVSEIFDKHFAKIVLEGSMGGVESGQSTPNLGLVNRKRGGREDIHTDGGLAVPKVKGMEGSEGSVGEDVMDKLQPVLLSRTEYVIKAFNHKHNEELWNVSYTDCKQLSASEGLAMLGGEDPFKPDTDLSGDKLLNGPHMKQFSKLAETLRVFTTVDNTIRVANTRKNMAPLWSEQLDSTPVAASLSDSISGHVHNIKLWSDEDESRGEEGNILVGIHAGGIFIMPNLKNDLRLGTGTEPAGDWGSNALAVPREIGSRLSSVMDVRGGGKSLMTFPLEDGSKDVQTMESLPVFFTQKKTKKEDESKGNDLDANVPARKEPPRGSKWTTFYMALMTLLIAVLFTFGGYLYEYYSNIENTQKQLREEMEKIEKMEKTDIQSPQVSNRKKIANEEVMIGNLIVSPKILGYGSAGTIVFEGSLNHRKVAVKRLLREFFHMAEKEIKALIVSDAHPSVLRCFAMEQDEEFIYLALERCQGTLHEFVNSQKFNKMVSEVVPLRMTSRQDVARNRSIVCQDFDVVRIAVPPALLEMISDIGKAISALHAMGIVHRDLKPQNVLLTRANKAKVSDMGLSKQLQAEQSSFDGTGMGSSGWQAPEVLLQKQQQLQRQSSIADMQDRPGSLKPVPEEGSGGMNSSTSKGGDSNDSAEYNTSGIRHTKAVDVFSFGCIIFYTLTRHHPFGDHIVQRDHNILNAKFDLKPMSMLRMHFGGHDGVEADKWKRTKAEGRKELESKENKDGDSVAAGDGPGDRKEGDAGEGAKDEAAGDKGQGESGQAEADGKEGKPEAYVPTWRRKSREKVHSFSSRPRMADTTLKIAYISWYEANNLVYAMITKNPRERPKMKAVMAHPFWWDFERRVNFIVNLSHRMEKEDTVTNPALLRSLENYGNEVLNKRPWHKQIDKTLWEESKQFRNYSVYSLRDLMRMIRNKVGHYRDNSDEVKEILGPVPNGVYTYFATTFPKLFMALYSFACKNLRSDPLLQRYFPDDVTPGDMVPFFMEETRPLDLYNDAGSAAVLVKEDEEYPRRPGEPVCEYFVKSGWCRYSNTCRFDHPPEYKVERNSIGYPLRPNQPECGHFARNGVCKFGAACKFSHPEKYLDPANREKHSAPSREKHNPASRDKRGRTSSR